MNYGIDTHKLMYHPDRVNQWLATGDTTPIYVEVSPTRRCNARCKFCAYGSVDRKESIDEEKKFYDTYIDNILPDMLELGVKAVMFAGEGEPLLNNNIDDMVKYTTRSGIDTSMTTNGLLLHDYLYIVDDLTWIKFSVDAGTPTTYNKIKGTSNMMFYKLIHDIERVCSRVKNLNSNCVVGVQMLLLPENCVEVRLLADICKGIGADYLVIKPFSPSDYVSTEYDNLKYSEMIKTVEEQLVGADYNVIFRANAFNDLNDISPTCGALPLWIYIASNGDVYPCLSYFDYKDYSIGNILDTRLIDIWNSNRRVTIYNRINSSREHCRVSCRMCSCNNYLQGLIDNNVTHVEMPEGNLPEHVNFI